MPRAYGFVGNMVSPAEVFPRLEALEAMAKTLEDAGHADAAAETREYLGEARDFAAMAKMHLDRLRSVWLAVETASGPYSTGNGQSKVESAVRSYRDSGRKP